MIIIDLWGFDHSGTLEGAGTIGGLLAMVRGWETWEEHSLVALDGLGNIIAYINPTVSVRRGASVRWHDRGMRTASLPHASSMMMAARSGAFIMLDA